MYLEEHRLEKQREATRRYRELHPEHKVKAAERYQAKKAADPEFLAKQREKTRKWRAGHPEAVKEIGRKSDVKRYHSLKAEAFALLGNRCARPHVKGDTFATDVEVLEIDHIDAIGDAERRRRNHRGRKLYKEVIKDPTPFQLLCACHNLKKKYELGEHLKWRKKKSDSRNITSALVND